MYTKASKPIGLYALTHTQTLLWPSCYPGSQGKCPLCFKHKQTPAYTEALIHKITQIHEFVYKRIGIHIHSNSNTCFDLSHQDVILGHRGSAPSVAQILIKRRITFLETGEFGQNRLSWLEPSEKNSSEGMQTSGRNLCRRAFSFWILPNIQNRHLYVQIGSFCTWQKKCFTRVIFVDTLRPPILLTGSFCFEPGWLFQHFLLWHCCPPVLFRFRSLRLLLPSGSGSLLGPKMVHRTNCPKFASVAKFRLDAIW